MRVLASDDQEVGRSVEALLECKTGAVSYVVVASGGVGGVKETLRAVPADAVQFDCEELRLSLTGDAFEEFEAIIEDQWPATPPGHPASPSAS